MSGPAHLLIVRSVGEPYGPLSTDEFEDWEIVHPPECPTRQQWMHDIQWTAYECGVGYQVESIGIRWSLHYSGTPVTKPGRYLIEAWHEVLRGFDWTEHDAGVVLCDQDTRCLHGHHLSLPWVSCYVCRPRPVSVGVVLDEDTDRA